MIRGRPHDWQKIRTIPKQRRGRDVIYITTIAGCPWCEVRRVVVKTHPGGELVSQPRLIWRVPSDLPRINDCRRSVPARRPRSATASRPVTFWWCFSFLVAGWVIAGYLEHFHVPVWWDMTVLLIAMLATAKVVDQFGRRRP